MNWVKDTPYSNCTLCVDVFKLLWIAHSSRERGRHTQREIERGIREKERGRHTQREIERGSSERERGRHTHWARER